MLRVRWVTRNIREPRVVVGVDFRIPDLDVSGGGWMVVRSGDEGRMNDKLEYPYPVED